MKKLETGSKMKYIVALLVVLINLTAFTLNSLEVELTSFEREYLNQLGTIKMGVDPDWYPLEFVDNNGNYSGIIPEILLLLENRLNVKFERVPTENWTETLEKSQKQDFLLIPALNRTRHRERWLYFTAPIMIEPNVAVTKKTFPQITDISEMKNVTLVTVPNYMIEDWVRKDLKDIKIIYRDTELECLQAVSEGKADLSIRSQLMTAYLIKAHGFDNLKINNQIPEYPNEIRMGVIKAEPFLVDILNKGIKTLTFIEVQAIINKFIYDNIETPPNYSMIITSVAIVILFTFLFLYWIRKLKKLNLLLKLGEEKQRAIIKAIPDGLTISDLNGKVTYVSKESVEMWGYSKKSDIIGKSVLGFVHPDYHEKTLKSIKSMIEGSNLGFSEYKMLRKSGRSFYCEANAEIIRDSNNKPYAILTVSRDITEKKKNELKLSEAVKRYESIMNQSRTLNWELDVNGLYTYISSNVKSILGFEKAEIVGKKYFYELFHEEKREELKKRGFDLINNKKTISNIETLLTNKAGQKMWFIASGLPKLNELGEMIGYQGSDTDITLRKNAEIRVEFQNRYQRMVATISARFMDVNLSNYQEKFKMMLEELGKLINASHTFILEFSHDRTHLEYAYEWWHHKDISSKELIGNIDISTVPLFTNIVEEQEKLFISNIDDLPQGSQEKLFFDKLKLKSILCIPIIRNNEFFGYFGFDSTTQKLSLPEEDIELLRIVSNIIGDVYIRNTIEAEKNSIQESLREASILAQQANKAKSDFLANMSHEIRTPLNGVIGFTELIMNTDLDPVQQQYAYHTNVSGQALLGIINDILDFSKIEAGKLDLDIVETDIHELIIHTVDILKYHADKKNIEFLLSVDPKLPAIIHTDSIRLKQVLINLLNNAIKFTQQGEVELNIEFKALDNKKGKFTFSVKDTGIGISVENKEKLFSAFSQADSSITRRYGGTGLGLTISNLLVEKMGSQIEVESTEGVGSNFFFSMITDYEVTDDTFCDPEKLNKRILLVDDNKNNLLIMERNLAHWKVDFISVDSAQKAIELLETDNQIDMAIVDYSMPDMDGIEAIKIIRARLRSYKQMPIILLHSSSEQEEISQLVQDLHIKHTLSKPINPNALRDYICEVFNPHEAGNNDSGHISKFTELAHKGFQKILIAEDVNINLILIKTLIGKIIPDSRILSVTNGQEAVDIFAKENFDLILMDVQMPIMDGLQATRLIREQEKNRKTKTPIIALTAGATKEDNVHCLEAGMDDFVTKPIDQERLINVLDEYLENRDVKKI